MVPQSLPFSIPKLYEGFATAHGIARMTSSGLTLEFEVKDGIVGMIKSGVREVQIAIDDLHVLELRKGWLRTRLFIRTRRMTAVTRIPGNRAGVIELRVAREDRHIAETLVSLLMLKLSERELEKLESDSAFGA